jgi:hypothetical protein
MDQTTVLFIVGTLISVGIVPLVRLIYNQERQIRALESLLAQQQEEIGLLRAIVLELAPAEVVKRHIQQSKPNHD